MKSWDSKTAWPRRAVRQWHPSGASAVLGFICISIYPALSGADHSLRHLHFAEVAAGHLLGRCTHLSIHHQSRQVLFHLRIFPPPPTHQATNPSRQHGAFNDAVRPPPGRAVCRFALVDHACSGHRHANCGFIQQLISIPYHQIVPCACNNATMGLQPVLFRARS